jgi:hypothetical protein
MTRAGWKKAIAWSLDGIAAGAEATNVVLSQTDHATLAQGAKVVAVLAGRAAEAVRREQ